MKCFDCPRMCGVDRTKSKGFCGESDKIRVSKIIENFMWEEPCISGEKGALAIFFSGCSLRCVFCQNYQISHIGKGTQYTPKQFNKLLSSYDLTKFSSIDLVTPSHFASQLYEAMKDFESPIPIVWNSSCYERAETIEKVSKFVNVFLPDFKFYSPQISLSLAKAENYFEVAKRAILAMKKAKSKNIFNDEGIMLEGLLIRHLVMPKMQADSFKILDFISGNINSPFISLMCQFTPTKYFNERTLYPLEYKSVLAHAERLGLTEGYFQDFSSANENFIPNF